MKRIPESLDQVGGMGGGAARPLTTTEVHPVKALIFVVVGNMLLVIQRNVPSNFFTSMILMCGDFRCQAQYHRYFYLD